MVPQMVASSGPALGPLAAILHPSAFTAFMQLHSCSLLRYILFPHQRSDGDAQRVFSICEDAVSPLFTGVSLFLIVMVAPARFATASILLLALDVFTMYS